MNPSPGLASIMGAARASTCRTLPTRWAKTGDTDESRRRRGRPPKGNNATTAPRQPKEKKKATRVKMKKPADHDEPKRKPTVMLIHSEGLPGDEEVICE